MIGQAAKFDYSGTQAVRILTDEGYILVNSNSATITTPPNLPDATYIEPVTPGWSASPKKEKPDAIPPDRHLAPH